MGECERERSGRFSGEGKSSSSCSRTKKTELILYSCNTVNNSEVSLGILGRCVALDLLYFLIMCPIGWRPCVLRLFLTAHNQERFRLVVRIHVEYPQVCMCLFLLPLISGRQKRGEISLFRDKKTGAQRGYVIHLRTHRRQRVGRWRYSSAIPPQEMN